MRPLLLLVLLCKSMCIVPIWCYYFDDSEICTENSIKQISEKTNCDNLFRGRHDYGYYDYRLPTCRPYTTTQVTEKTITCENTTANYLANYRESPEEGPPYPLTLKVSDSEIPVLPTSTFKNLNNLTVLVLEDIKLTKIMPGAFNFLGKLKEVRLGQNQLAIVSDGIFNSLTALETIDLSRNRIESITDDAFAGIALSSLNLSHNRIAIFGELLTKSLMHLTSLDISQNNLQNISSLHDLPINSLNLSCNSIEFVDFEDFPTTRSRFIDISFNNISEVANFNISNSYEIILSHNSLQDLVVSDSGNTNVLDISYNNVATIDSLSVKLVRFYASSNSISFLAPDTFSGLDNLAYLYLDNNNLTSIPNSCFKDLSSLTHLNLSGNKLEQFTFGTFDNLKKLEVLDISNNRFKELPQYTFHSLSTLTDLFFQNNEISNINTDDLLEHMGSLEKINLENNVWSCQKLLNILHVVKTKRISFPEGTYWEESNIHGIRCHETFRNAGLGNVSNSDVNLGDSKLNSFFNEDFTKTMLYKYFNQNFKDSEFFKYLESLKASVNSTNTEITVNSTLQKLLNGFNSKVEDVDFKNSGMYNYFNKDFRNSSFFKYFENFTKQTTSKSDELTVEKVDEISNSFKNLTKDLENILKVKNSPNIDFEKSNMYNYFNKDFKSSNFFKYLESLNIVSALGKNPENINQSRAEQLVNPIRINEYPKSILYLNTLFVMLILVVILIAAYRLILRKNTLTLPSKEEVELI